MQDICNTYYCIPESHRIPFAFRASKSDAYVSHTEYCAVDRKYGLDQLFCFQLYIGLETETINQHLSDIH